MRIESIYSRSNGLYHLTFQTRYGIPLAYQYTALLRNPFTPHVVGYLLPLFKHDL